MVLPLVSSVGWETALLKSWKRFARNATILLWIKIVLACFTRPLDMPWTMLETTKGIDVFRTKPILRPMYISLASLVLFLLRLRRSGRTIFCLVECLSVCMVPLLFPLAPPPYSFFFFFCFSAGVLRSQRICTLFSQLTKCLSFLSLTSPNLFRTKNLFNFLALCSLRGQPILFSWENNTIYYKYLYRDDRCYLHFEHCYVTKTKTDITAI